MGQIVVSDVSKKFKIPRERRTTIFQNIIGALRRQFDYTEFWALRNVSFTVNEGETFGIIGRNGSGKSTLLKILAKVLYPDTGRVSIEGKVACFLELGVGFQPELSARDNVFLYASILGMNRREIERKYDSIMAFAELEKFENMKLKNFSSGMYIRLAFSTAVHSEPDVLLIDEIFAVGDEAFQRKSEARMMEFREMGKTIIFVSHNMNAIKKLCRRTLWLKAGEVAALGDTEDVVARYLEEVK